MNLQAKIKQNLNEKQKKTKTCRLIVLFACARDFYIFKLCLWLNINADFFSYTSIDNFPKHFFLCDTMRYYYYYPTKDLQFLFLSFLIDTFEGLKRAAQLTFQATTYQDFLLFFIWY